MLGNEAENPISQGLISENQLDVRVETLQWKFRRDMAAMEVRLMKWVLVTMIASMGTGIACAGPAAHAIGEMMH